MTRDEVMAIQEQSLEWMYGEWTECKNESKYTPWQQAFYERAKILHDATCNQLRSMDAERSALKGEAILRECVRMLREYSLDKPRFAAHCDEAIAKIRAILSA